MWTLAVVWNFPSDLSGKTKKHQHQACHSWEKVSETIAELFLQKCSITHAPDGREDNILHATMQTMMTLKQEVIRNWTLNVKKF